jgi:hypothetical protein
LLGISLKFTLPIKRESVTDPIQDFKFQNDLLPNLISNEEQTTLKESIEEHLLKNISIKHAKENFQAGRNRTII